MTRTDRAHERVSAYARAASIPDRWCDAITRASPRLLHESVWCVDTKIWWERRYFFFRGARETETIDGQYIFDGLRRPADSFPDRWRVPFDRPPVFRSAEVRLPVRGIANGEIEITFGTNEVAWTFGDPAFPVSLRGRLAVRATFEGIDSQPTMEERGSSPYREAQLPSDASVPTDVMDKIRDFVREIDLPGYSARIHGWRTLVEGGPIAHLAYDLATEDESRRVEAVVFNDGFVYAPDVTDLRG